jgi:catechol 2,3-dioxygenase-like lactoylglutathione lyase family enzyme
MSAPMPAAASWTDRQLPIGDEVFLDHVGLFVPDLEAAGRRLERLGFGVSPINLQQNADATGALQPSGTSNRLAVMRRGFIEILAATHETPLATQLRQALERYQGIHLIALSHADVPAQRDRLTAAGFRMQPVVHLRRHKQTPEGLREVAWSVLRPEPGVMAEGRVQFAFCHTPELTWPEGPTPPENGADGLTDLLLCVEDRHEAAARYGRFAGRPPTAKDGLCVVTLDRGRLLFAQPEDVARILPGLALPAVPCMVGQAVRSASRAATQDALRRYGVTPLFASAGLICVGPADALGSCLLFHAPSVSAPWSALAEHRS